MLEELKVSLREQLKSERSLFKVWDILRIWGPAWLVMMADVDAASVITAAESGIKYGTRLIWFLLVLTCLFSNRPFGVYA